MVQMTCLAQLRSGALVELLPGAIPFPATSWAVYPLTRGRSAATRALVAHLARTVPSLLGPVEDIA